MPDFPSTVGGTRMQNGSVTAASSEPFYMTANASTNTKGAYVELISSTSFEANGLFITLRRGNLNGDALIDIAIGGSGSEQVVVPNIGFACQVLRYGTSFFIPFYIPAGSRISARVQATTGSATVGIQVVPIGGSLINQPGFSRAINYGATTADSGGTQVDPGGTINTKGSYSEITSATTAPIRYLVVAVTNQNNGTGTTAAWLFDIAIGGSGSEVVIVPDLMEVLDSNLDTLTPCHYCFPVNIPVGSRIAIRAQCSINDATDRLIDFNLIGIG